MRSRKRSESDIEKETEYKVSKKELRQLIRKAKISVWRSLIQTIDRPMGSSLSTGNEQVAQELPTDNGNVRHGCAE